MSAKDTIRRFINRLRVKVRVGLREAYARLPFRGIRSPVFILGCGRSGTTIFGRTLQHHDRITYLNERRDLWTAAYPETDIWSDQAERRGGTLSLGAQDAVTSKSRRLGRYFLFQTRKTGRPVLVEKLPINNFRIGLIAEAFPDARFVHIHRNGLEVARSVQKICQDGGQWFGEGDYKWHQIVDHASGDSATSVLPELARTPYEKALLEWRLSTEAAVAFLAKKPADSFTELSYSDFVADPVGSISEVLNFLGLDLTQAVRQFANTEIRRQSSPITRTRLSDKESTIGGRLLRPSLSGKKLTKHHAG